MYNQTKPYIDKILKLVEQTRKHKRSLMPASSDGIGTKGIYHWQRRTFREGTLDALGMNYNDIAVFGGKANYLQDHIMLPQEDDEAIFEIVGTLVEECKKRDTEITAGETSIHDNLEGLEISLSIYQGYHTSLDYLKNNFVWPCSLVGIKSSGLHSNGFTKIRQLFGKEFRPEFVEPTLIYYDLVRELEKEFDISGKVHITGGAYTKLKKFLQEYDADALINPDKNFNSHEIFKEIYRRGVSDEEMYKTFNCGVGFILGVDKKDLEKVLSEINEKGFEASKIGETRKGSGKVIINSAFSGRKIIL